MFEAPDVMRVAQDMARHAARRQAVTAENTANADTPGYRASDIGSFAKTFRGPAAPMSMVQRYSEHLANTTAHPTPRPFDSGGQAAPNGNTVSLEQELIRSGEAKSEHDTALAIYKSSMDLLRTTIGRGR